MSGHKPAVFIISAPSGSGKSTLVSRLMRDVPRLVFSVSYTTRAPRGAEKDGENYHFIAREEFETRIGRDEFLEYAQVFGNYYGTHQSVIDQAAAAGADVVLDIDVQGAGQLRQRVPDAVTIFVLAPSRQVLETRLRSRGEDSDAVIERRLKDAAREIERYHQYDYVLVNDNIDDSAETLCGIIRAERVRRQRMDEKLKPILDSFNS